MVDKYYCYVLYNDINNSTYNGSTNNLERRLNQHNGLLAGGAKATSKCRGHWSYLAIVESESFTQRNALRVEWQIKYPDSKRPRSKEYFGPRGRLNGLETALTNKKFEEMFFTVYVANEYYDVDMIKSAKIKSISLDEY